MVSMSFPLIEVHIGEMLITSYQVSVKTSMCINHIASNIEKKTCIDIKIQTNHIRVSLMLSILLRVLSGP